jgi:hypothetical protein
MARNSKGPNVAWTLLGWINLVAIVLFILVFTGTRPTAGAILIGTVIFVAISILLVWVAFRRR